MRTLLGALFLTAVAGAQSGAIPPVGQKPVAPVAGRGGTATPPGRGAPSPGDLKYPAPGVIQTPDFSVSTLPNGMKLYLLEDHELPIVGGVAMVRTGSVLDPPDRIGLAQLAGIAMRTGGTAIKTGEQVDAFLDGLASSAESYIGEFSASFSFAGLKENSPATLQLFKEMLTQPGFRGDKVEQAKTQLRVGISHRNDDAGVVARRELAGLVYGKDSPLGWHPDFATITHISRGDLRAFHQRYFFPANTILAVWGDFNRAEMKASVEALFAGWTVKQAEVPDFPKVKTTPSPGVYLVERKDAAQVSFSIGHLGGRRDDKDYAALEILSALLGSGPQSRIPVHLRTKLGIASETVATWNAGFARQGLLEIFGSANGIFAVEAIKAIEEEIERIRGSEVTEDEWRSARDAAVNRLIFTDDSRSKLFARRVILDYFGYPKDYLQVYQKALASVTRADLLRVARQYLIPANLTIVLVANPTMLGEGLSTLGPVTKLDVAIPEPKPEVVEKTDASLAEGRQILLQAQAAAGGSEKLAAVKDYTMVAEYLFDPSVPSVGGGKIVQTDKWVAPSVLRQEATLPIGRVTAYTDGKVGWVASGQGLGALAGPQRAQMLGDIFRVTYRLLLSDRLEGRTVNAIDDSSVQISDGAGQMASVEFDPATHLISRVSFDIPQAGGAPAYQEEIYDDYRDVGGIKVPFKITVNQAGRRYADAVVKDYKINSGMNALELARRPQ